MNWVGGSLSRHRRGKGWKEDLANQKRYFAKARSRRREQAKTSPVVLSAANFIPNYSAASTAAARVVRSSSPPSLPVPLDTCGNPKRSAIPASPSQNFQHDAAKRLSYAVPPSQTSGSAVLNNQSKNDNLEGTSVPEADRRRLLKAEDLMQSKLPKLSKAKPAQKRGHSTATGQAVGQHRRQSAVPTSHREIRPNVGDQRGNRKRRLSQITSPPVDTTIRIRVGSKSYQWSEAGNSIRDPTYSNNSSPSRSADESRCIASTAGNTSHVIDESFSGLSSSTISPSPRFSPKNRRPAQRRKFSDPTKHLDRAGSTKSQCPMIVYTDTLSLLVRPPTMSASSSVSSMTVEVDNEQEPQKTAVDEEDVWRAWLNQDMPELQVPKRQQDITADTIRRPLPTPVPRELAIATLPIQADCDSALQEPSVKLKRWSGGWP